MGSITLGDLIARLDRPSVAASVLASLDPAIRRRIEERAADAAMAAADFAADAVREFIECRDDELWFQLLTIMRQSDDPGLAAVQTILTWVVTEK